jgi:hypothetical protein
MHPWCRILPRSDLSLALLHATLPIPCVETIRMRRMVHIHDPAHCGGGLLHRHYACRAERANAIATGTACARWPTKRLFVTAAPAPDAPAGCH